MQTVRSNALSFLHTPLPEEPRLLHRGGDWGGGFQRVRVKKRTRGCSTKVYLRALKCVDEKEMVERSGSRIGERTQSCRVERESTEGKQSQVCERAT